MAKKKCLKFMCTFVNTNVKLIRDLLRGNNIKIISKHSKQKRENCIQIAININTGPVNEIYSNSYKGIVAFSTISAK